MRFAHPGNPLLIKNLISFVIPLKDEEKTVRETFERIAEQMTGLNRQFEAIFIDDGSADGSWAVIRALSEEHPGKVGAIRFHRNCGKAHALAVGFEAARGDIVFTMDADLRDDPKEIGRFLEKLDEGYDIVSGSKSNRHDAWHKVLHDHSCGFKCCRAEVIKNVRLYGQMHRMSPSPGGINGFRAAEIVIRRHPRVHGQSKHWARRLLRGFMGVQPRDSAPVMDNIAPITFPVDRTGEGQTVLVAEDEAGIRDLMRSHLEEAGFHVEEAGNDEETLAKLNDGVGIVLLDLAAPGKSGLERLAQMKRRHADIPIVVVSGNDEIPTAVRAMKLGAFDYLTKPFDARQLVQTIQKALRMRGLVSELIRTA